jgi:hypothetical protein
VCCIRSMLWTWTEQQESLTELELLRETLSLCAQCWESQSRAALCLEPS